MGMEMHGMGMGGGMSMESDGPFKATDMAIARGYWYGIVACIGLLAMIRIVDNALKWSSSRRRRRSHLLASRPFNMLVQVYATATAVMREITYPQPLVFRGALLKHFSPPPLGRTLIILTYWSILLAFLWTDTILTPTDPLYGYKWEKVAFRAAWVSVTQVPLIYCLSCKFNIISIITGISYERLNWLHRWGALTLFFTVIVHWSFFFREWSIADFVSFELSMMPMVKYGFGAWGVVGWMTLSGWGYFRELAYELFVLQHILSACILLWLLHVHVPSYAAYNIWMAISFVVLDRVVRGLWSFYHNAHVARGWVRRKWRIVGLGYRAELEPLLGDVTRVIVRDVDFTWTAGQHVFISIPAVGLVQSHPFTIANICKDPVAGENNTLELFVKAHSGFSKRLLHRATKAKHPDAQSVRIFLSGPWGYPPSLESYDTLILIAASTGITFTLPLLQDVATRPLSIRRICFHWVIRKRGQIPWFQTQLTEIMGKLKESGIILEVSISVTADDFASDITTCCCDLESGSTLQSSEPLLNSSSPSSSPSSRMSGTSTDSIGKSHLHVQSTVGGQGCFCGRFGLGPNIIFSVGCRPSMERLIRAPVEDALGETAVVVCGGESLTAATRNFVAGLSDERAVHKGTGARGIFLFTESFGW